MEFTPFDGKLDDASFEPFDGKLDEEFVPFNGQLDQTAPASGGKASIPGSEAYDKNPPKPHDESLGEKSLGILETGATALTGAVAPFAGMFGSAQDTFRQGVKNLVTGNHDTQVDFRKRADEIAAGLTYQPRTETGQTIAEKVLAPVGESLQALGPLAPHFTTGGQVVGAKMLLKKGERAVEVPSSKLEGLDAAIAEKKAAAEAPRAPAPEPVNPMERTATDLGAAPEDVAVARQAVAENQLRDEAAAPGRTPMTDMANTLENREKLRAGAIEELLQEQEAAKTAQVQSVLERRQAELEQAMQQRVTLEQNARMRAQQEQASVYSPEYQQHVAAVEQAKQAEAQARAVAQQELAASQEAALGSQQRAEATRRAQEAQRQLELRQQDLEMAVKRQTALDMNAAERQRQMGASAFSDAERTRLAAAAFEEKKAQWAAEDARLAMEADKSARRHQMEIDDTQHAGPGEIYGAQYGTEKGIGRVDENGMPIRADLSMEAQNLQNPLQRNLWGDELGPALGQQRSLTKAIDLMPKGPERTNALGLFNQRTRKQGGGVYMGEIRKAQDESPIRWFTASPEAGRTRTYSLESQAARPNAEAQRYGPGQYIAQSRDFSSVYGGKEGRMYEVPAPFSRPFDVTKASNEKIYQSLVERTGSRAEANKLLQKSGYDAITFTSPRGDKLANIFNEVPLKDIGPAREKVRQQILTLESYEPGSRNDPLAKQRGMIRLPGSAEKSVERLKGVEAFRAAMKPLAVDRSTPEQFIAANKDLPDVQQNVVQKAFNGLTKGSIYMSDRLNNPLYTRVTARFREADSLAKGAQQQIVHDIYAPTIRALSDQEKAHVWSALKKMEDNGVRIDDNKLVDLGFNQKERDAIKVHQTIMDEMIPKINEALDAVGMSHIHPQSAYLASKLTGTFRKVMLDKDNNVIGALGDRTRAGLLKQEAEFKKLHPEAVAGKEQVMGSRGNTNNMADLINFLSDKDPHMAEYLQASKEAAAKDAMSYRGAKTHTMEKKGVIGMAGAKPWESAITNAREGFDAQVTYLNRMLEWAEKAKAEADVRPLLDSPELNMPNAKQMASDYRDFSLGKNPYDLAKVSDAIGDYFGKAFGGKLSYLGDLTRGTKKAVNIKLLSANPGFLAANIMQPIRNMPELAAFLKSRGAASTEVMGLGSMGKVSTQMATGRFSPILKEAMDYADQHHVYASDLIDQRHGTGKAFSGDGVGQKISSTADAIEHGLQMPASKIEGVTRKTFFLTMVDMLHENGIRKQDGLFDIAANLTDRGMNRYSADEAPIMIKAMGSAGRLPYNLMSFKFNELSRVASLARELKPTQLASAAPILTALSMQVAAAGLMGTMGYVEANEIVKAISKAMGQPTSLTKILLDHGDQKVVGPVTLKQLAYGGLSTATETDWSGRMGVGALAGSTNLADVVLPGASSLGTAAKSLYDFASDPTKYNAAKAAIDILPGGNLLDRQLFSKNKGTDKEMGFNRNRVESGVVRTPADKMAKNFGMTGVNESSKKTAMYENQQIDKWYTDKQKSAVERMGQDFFSNGKVSKESIEKYKKAQGDLNNLEKIIDTIAQEQNIPADKRDLLKAAAQAQTNPNKIKRRFY